MFNPVFTYLFFIFTFSCLHKINCLSVSISAVYCLYLV